jgi:hypothetical protein
MDRLRRFALTGAPPAGLGSSGLIRIALRLIALVSLAGAFAAAVIDGARSLADQKIEFTPMGRTLATAFPYVSARAPVLWDPVLLKLLYAPAALDLAVLGAALFYLAHRPAVPPGAGRRGR